MTSILHAIQEDGVSSPDTRSSLRGSGLLAADGLESEVSRWELDPSEIELSSELGSGAFGVVYKGKLRGKDVAIKKIKLDGSANNETLDQFRIECAIMSKLRHPNVLLFMGACILPDSLMIVTEVMPRGSIESILKDPNVTKTLPFAKRMKMAKDAALGMNWLHLSKPIFIHRDLKCGNLLVDSNWTVKVADFGLSLVKAQGETQHFGAIGTPMWMAPEVLDNKPYNETADVYSYAIVLWELLTGESPFSDIESFDELVEAVVKEKRRPEIPASAPPTLKELITKCWDADPNNRPNFATILEEFDDIIIEGVLGDPQAVLFWKKNFRGCEKAKFDIFARKLGLFCKEKNVKPGDEVYRCLRELLATNEFVTMEAFRDFLQWFGPLKPNPEVCKRVVELLKEPWFHGDLSTPAAEKMLTAAATEGSFLVRFSTSDPGSYSISSLSKDKRVKHVRVGHKAGGPYIIANHQLQSLQDIISKFGTVLGLLTACPGSKYQHIFAAAEDDNFGVYMSNDDLSGF